MLRCDNFELSRSAAHTEIFFSIHFLSFLLWCAACCVCTRSSFRQVIFVALHLSKSSRPPVSCWNFYLFVLVLVMTLLMNADLTPWNFVCVPSSIVDNCACHTRLSTSAHQIVLWSIFALLFLMKRSVIFLSGHYVPVALRVLCRDLISTAAWISDCGTICTSYVRLHKKLAVGERAFMRVKNLREIHAHD